jgi:hypothetical protein
VRSARSSVCLTRGVGTLLTAGWRQLVKRLGRADAGRD